MPEHLTVDQVRHVAKLSRLELSSDELAHFAEQLSSVLEYIAKLNELDLEGIEPMAHAIDVTNVTREDQPVQGLPIDVVLHNAPAKDSPFFMVPKVLGDSSGA